VILLAPASLTRSAHSAEFVVKPATHPHPFFHCISGTT
jgi:hypothetical protein